jgi:hypothetical protein
MTHNQLKASSWRNQWLAGAVGLLLVGGTAGGVLAATSTASAVGTTASPTAVTQRSGSGGETATPVRSGEKTAIPIHPGEKAEAGTNLSALKATALKAVPGGTVYRVETDADDATYEAHMTKADGTHVTVKFDKNLAVKTVEGGMGAGGDDRPGGAHSDDQDGHDGTPSAHS